MCYEIRMVALKGKGPCQTWGGTHRKLDGRPMLGRLYAYRVLYEALRGPIPPGMVAHHKCENPRCVNPWHIELKAQGAHLRDHGNTGDNHQRFKTHCPAGHPYDEQNTYHYRNERHCKECVRENKRRWRTRTA